MALRGFTICLLGLASIPATLSLPEASGDAAGTIGKPSLYQSPRFRWWWPGGWIEPDQITDEIRSIIQAGFGGGEIGDVEASVSQPDDPRTYGWARPRWNAGIKAAYEESNKLGGHVDLTLGPYWPTGFPGYTPDSPSTMKELVHGQSLIEAGKTFDGKLPLPLTAPSGNSTVNNVKTTPKLVAVLVAKTNVTSASDAVIGFTANTVQVITKNVYDKDKIKWTAPRGGNYILVAVYGWGTGQIQNRYDMPSLAKLEITYPFPAYIVDHFSKAGFEAGEKYWSQHILSQELRGLISKSGGSIFEDSLELKTTQYWTADFADEFKTRRGYGLEPFLLYVLKDNSTFLGDSTIGSQITNDFYQTVSDLYIDNRLKPLKKWANSLGLKFRNQPYTASFDSAQIASLTDIPEGESLAFDGSPDSFRVLAAGRDFGDSTILSDELGAYLFKAYATTWKFLLSTINLDMSLGVSQIVIHGFPYQTSPTSLWPGFAAFTAFALGDNQIGFADAWGARQPQWTHAKIASSYIAHAQKILQESKPSTDVGILYDGWGVAASWSDDSLNAAGYSYQFPTPNLLVSSDAQVEDGKLAVKGPAYKALVINSTSMNVETANLLLNYGKKGLPIVVLGELPETTFGYAKDSQSEERKLKTALESIKSLKTTSIVGESSSVPRALKRLGVSPSVQYQSGLNATLTTLRRVKDSGYLYWIYNGGDDAYSGTVRLEGEGQPLEIDLYSGSVSPIATFQQSAGRISLSINVAPNAAAAIYVGSKNSFGVKSPTYHLTSSTCDSYVKEGAVYIASNESCTAQTSNGKTIKFSPSKSVPPSISSFNWDLSVLDWSPVDVNEVGLDSYKTKKTTLPSVKLDNLHSWSKIDSLKNASGVGTYTTQVEFKKENNARVLLDVGDVEGSWAVKVNGKAPGGADWFGSKPIDITNLVKTGKNSIEIVVSTTLWNKLRETWSAVFGSEDAQDVGLLGPAHLYFQEEQMVR